ncbi:MAG: hypothetical protein LBI13_01360 [Streptococcaceae bacterium]|nr:hypothetical protein [Streptococcaceae bacterium]
MSSEKNLRLKKGRIVKYVIILFLVFVSFFLIFREQIPIFLPHEEKVFTRNISENNVEPDITIAKNNSNISVNMYFSDGTENTDKLYGSEKKRTFSAGLGENKIIAKNDSDHIIFGYLYIWDND